MQIITRLIIISLMLFSCQYGQASPTTASSPVGFWKTIDDITGKPRAIINLTETGNHIFSGRIIKTFPGPNENINDICSACQGERHNKRILGMVILKNLQKDKNTPNEWNGGEILDPKSGKVYHCRLQVVANGQKLSVRGYLGLPLFGRTQTWLRVPNPN